MDEEIRQAIEQTKEQLPVEIDLKWYRGVIKLDEVKQYIRANINSASRSFVAIGYYLKYIRDNQLYKDEGYTGISDFAKAEFGISAAQASKFMSINDRFSVERNSPILQDRYREFSSSKLSEMLYLTDEQLEQVTVATTNVEIREIKNPIKQSDTFSVPKTEPVLSALGKPKRIYLEGDLLSTPGCLGGSCFSCARDCQIRDEDRYCVDAPLGHPFYCDTMYIDPDQLGSDCMFINFDLAYHRAGDHEPSPCCKECKNQCEYICKRAAKEQDPVVIEPATPEPEYIETVNDTPEPDTKITEDEFVIAFYRFMYDSEKQLAQEKNSEQLRAELIKHYGKRYTNTNCILDGWTVCYPDKVVFRQNGNHTDQMQLSWGKVVSRLFKLIDEGRIVIFKPVNDDVNYTSENVDNELEIVNDVDEAVIEDKSCSNCKYNDMDPDEYRRGHLDKTIELPCNNCDDKLNHWEQKVDGLELDCFNEEEGWHKEIIINEPDPVETVTADIIQTVPDEQSKPKRPSIAGYMDDPYCPECKAGLIYKCDCLKCGCKIDWEPVKGLFEYEEEQLQKR
jgi:hypothetical protein